MEMETSNGAPAALALLKARLLIHNVPGAADKWERVASSLPSGAAAPAAAAAILLVVAFRGLLTIAAAEWLTPWCHR